MSTNYWKSGHRRTLIFTNYFFVILVSLFGRAAGFDGGFRNSDLLVLEIRLCLRWCDSVTTEPNLAI